jgi:hypothetical protein
MFSAIWVSTGKSASATLIHWAPHPVVTREMLKTRASMILLVEITFISSSPSEIRLDEIESNSRAMLGPDSRGRLSPDGRCWPKTKSPSAEADGDSVWTNNLRIYG